MKSPHRTMAMIALAACLALAGCTPRFVITQELEGPLQSPGQVRIGSVTDLLPADIAEQDRPSLEDIEKFKKYLCKEIENRDHMDLLVAEGENADYEIRGRLLEYKKGSGFLRFVVGLGAGSARVLVELKLVNTVDDATLFCGNFEGQVNDGLDSGDRMFKLVAKDFTLELEKQIGKKPVPTSEFGL
jgi:hypothetical protein